MIVVLVWMINSMIVGWVEVFLCDKWSKLAEFVELIFLIVDITVGRLDGLWENHRTTRISIPEYFVETLQTKFCANHTHPFITVTHGNNGPDDHRQKYKFKIIGVKVCATTALT